MFDFTSNKNDRNFSPTKGMIEAAIIKGQKIGLSNEDIIEMAALMDKSKSRDKIARLVARVLSKN